MCYFFTHTHTHVDLHTGCVYRISFLSKYRDEYLLVFWLIENELTEYSLTTTIIKAPKYDENDWQFQIISPIYLWNNNRKQMIDCWLSIDIFFRNLAIFIFIHTVSDFHPKKTGICTCNHVFQDFKWNGFGCVQLHVIMSTNIQEQMGQCIQLMKLVFESFKNMVRSKIERNCQLNMIIIIIKIEQSTTWL